MYYLPDSLEEYLPKRWLLKKRIKSFIWGFTIAAVIFTGLGYSWRMAQTDRPHQEEIAKLNQMILNYRNNWTPIKQGRR